MYVWQCPHQSSDEAARRLSIRSELGDLQERTKKDEMDHMRQQLQSEYEVELAEQQQKHEKTLDVEQSQRQEQVLELQAQLQKVYFQFFSLQK